VRTRHLTLLAALISLGAVSARAQSTFLSMNSEPGDPIGQGQQWLIPSSAGTFTAERNIDNGVSVRFFGPGPFNYWFLDFAAASDVTLVPAMYEGATRYPLQAPTAPGLFVVGQGGFCDTLSGRFVVLEAVYGPGGEVLQFAADFEQHCLGAAPALYGSIRFNSSVTVAPRASVNSVTLTEGDGGAVDAAFLVSLSTPSPVDVTVDYQAADGTATAGLDYAPTAGTVTFPAGETVVTASVPVLGDEIDETTETYRVLLGNPTNAAIAFGEGTGTIVDDDPEKTFLYLDSDPGDYIGGGVVRRFQATDGPFEALHLDPEGVRITFGGPGFWQLFFVAPHLAPLTPGVYEDAHHAYDDLNFPGLTITGNGHACGASRGRFVVLEAVYGPGGEVERFAADFEQRCVNFEAALVGSVRYHSQATITGASVRPFQVGEGWSVATATVTLSWPVSHPVTVAFQTADGSATTPADYTAASGVVTFAPGETGVDVEIPVFPDSTEEVDERFDLRLTGATGGTVLRTRSWVTIMDDDPRYPFELGHGTVQRRSLAFPNLDGDAFALAEDPYSSWEAVVDETSGDVGGAFGLSVQLHASSGVLVAFSEPVGAGPSQSMRFANQGSTAITDRRILVKSTSCSSDCTADDTYRIRFYDTTYRIARYNTTGGQRAVLLLQNPTAQLVRGWARLWNPSGTLTGEAQIFLEPHGSTVIDLNTMTGASGSAGSITVASDAPYAALTGKLVGLDPATGFSFDSPMLPRPR
jgi:Calx-beta domain